jgi:hypothetical protein
MFDKEKGGPIYPENACLGLFKVGRYPNWVGRSLPYFLSFESYSDL